jgi:hypothetical protein
MHCLGSSEFRDGMTVYWIANGDNPKDFGICFEGERVNIARQGMVESMLFSMQLGGEQMDEFIAHDDEKKAEG